MSCGGSARARQRSRTNTDARLDPRLATPSPQRTYVVKLLRHRCWAALPKRPAAGSERASSRLQQKQHSNGICNAPIRQARRSNYCNTVCNDSHYQSNSTLSTVNVRVTCIYNMHIHVYTMNMNMCIDTCADAKAPRRPGLCDTGRCTSRPMAEPRTPRRTPEHAPAPPRAKGCTGGLCDFA